ncbi:MAG: tetratricopeptide repeat protein [Saprospiraceae bacterium]|nr:tetratricopeptide repeat protein [Saprospiraceae bacterium]
MGRFYHNTTAYYNGYFNANVLLEASEVKLGVNNQDNYTQILDVYDYVNVADPEKVKEDLDKAIEKVSVVATLHRPSHWVDDCYLLVGKAQYLKHDYEASEETLVYLKEAYSPEAMELRKKTINKKARAKAREDERREKKKIQEKEREERQKQLEEKRDAKREAAEKSRKERKREAAKAAKERRKEAKRRKKEREKEAKARAKARKNGKKLPRKKSSVPTPVESDSLNNVDQPIEQINTTPEPEPTPEEVADTAEPDEADVAPEEKKPKKENYLFKHRPAYAEGMLWLGRTYTERHLYEDAMRAFTEAAIHPTASPEVIREIPVAQAHLFLERGMYDGAIPYLRSAITLAKKKKEKARYQYILGQIYQQQNQYAQSVEAFRAVVKLRPVYEMEFNARLNLLLGEYRSGQTPVADCRKDMERLLKDKKNEDYRDRIHYALADMDLDLLDTASAIVNLKESARFSTKNISQRTETHLKLAELYFDQELYVEAKVYYDLVIKEMPATDERYNMASLLSKNLTDIARNIQVITLQDSLLTIAGLSEKDRVELAEQIKADRLAKANELSANQQNDQKSNSRNLAVSQGQFGARNTPSTGPAKSNFFAYDSKSLDRGLKDFKSYWGNDRLLEDNWRRSNRSTSFQVEEAESAEEAIETSLTDSELQEMFKDVPMTPEAVTEAETKIQNAMIALGRLYRERLQNNQKTVEVLSELLERFPGTEHELDAWYFLYLAHHELGETSQARKYYDLIMGKYPESTYARVLGDPNYLGESREKERQLNAYYKQTYDDFSHARYDMAWAKLEQVDTLFGPDNRLQAKFVLLRAMTTGNREGMDAYIAALKDLVSKYPDTEEETRAKEILRLLGDKSVAPKDLPNQNTQESEFNLDPEGTHYVIINWSLTQVELQDAQNAVNAFNRKYFKSDRLRLSSNIFLSVDVPLMVVRKFDSADKAMEYYQIIEKYKEEFLGKAEAGLKVFPVTQQNYRVILKNRSLDAYEPFFIANYL